MKNLLSLVVLSLLFYSNVKAEDTPSSPTEHGPLFNYAVELKKINIDVIYYCMKFYKEYHKWPNSTAELNAYSNVDNYNIDFTKYTSIIIEPKSLTQLNLSFTIKKEKFITKTNVDTIGMIRIYINSIDKIVFNGIDSRSIMTNISFGEMPINEERTFNDYFIDLWFKADNNLKRGEDRMLILREK